MKSEEPRSLVVRQIEEIEGNESSFALRNALSVLFRHKWKAIIIFIGTVLIMTVYMLNKPDIYESQAQLLIKAGRENISWDATALGSISLGRQNGLSAELAILTSGHIIARIVDKIGPEALLATSYKDTSRTHSGEAIKQLMKNLTVSAGKNSQIVYLSFKAQSPRLARDVINSLIDFYMERRIEVHQPQVSPKFFREQSEKRLAELVQKEEQLKQFSEKQGIVSIVGQKEALLGQINSLNSGIDNTISQISSSQGIIAWLEKNMQELSETTELSRVPGMSNATIDAIQQRLIDLRLRETDLASKFIDPTLLDHNLREQIRLTEADLMEEQEIAIKNALETENMNIQQQMIQKQLLSEMLEKRKGDLMALTNHEMKLRSIQVEVDIAMGEYRQYRDNYHQAKITAALDADKVSNVTIIQPATMPIEPIKSKKKRNIALGVLLGLFGGIGLAYVREFLDDSVKTNEDVKKRLGLPVLATISHKKVEPT